MSLRPFFPVAILAVMLLAGCSTSQPAKTPAPAESTPLPSTGTAPQPSAPVVPAPTSAPADARPATIKGSEESSTLLDNFTAFVSAVDGQAVPAGRKGWDLAISLTPGPHQLTVEFNRGVFLARAELKLDARPGAAYQLRHVSDAQVYGNHTYCEFWIVDLATGEKVMPAQRTGLTSVKAGG